MSPFLEGIIGGITLLAGLGSINYWMYSMFEKKLEGKLDTVSSDVQKIANELREERLSKDHLYKFVLDNYKDKNDR